MKTNILRQITFAFLLILSASALAQQKPKEHISREKMAEAKAKNIAAELKLEDDVYNKFVETYKNCQKELWGTAPKHHKCGRSKNNDTEEKAAERMKEQFERSQKMLDIRNKYYNEFSKFLTQRQIEYMYKQEKKITQRLKERQKKHRPHHGDQNESK